MPRVIAILAIAAATIAACAEAVPRDADNFYEGRQLEVIVPFGPGGGTDSWARLVAPFLQQHLPGSTVQVMNIAGATSIAGVNEFATRRRADGLTGVVTAGSTYYLYMLGEPAVQYEFRDFAPIMLSPVGGVVFVSPDIGVRNVRDLLTAQEELVYGGISATGNDIMALLAFELLGLDVKTILGYTSKGASRVAFEQGETNIEYQTMPAYLMNVQPLIEAGHAVPLMSFGVLDDDGNLIRDPSTPDLPTVGEAYREMYGREPVGRAWEAYRAFLGAGTMMQKVLWLHRDAPPASIDALRRAAREVASDSVFREAAYTEIGDYPVLVGEDASRVINSATEVPAETVEWLKALLRDKYGVESL